MEDWEKEFEELMDAEMKKYALMVSGKKNPHLKVYPEQQPRILRDVIGKLLAKQRAGLVGDLDILWDYLIELDIKDKEWQQVFSNIKSAYITNAKITNYIIIIILILSMVCILFNMIRMGMR